MMGNESGHVTREEITDIEKRIVKAPEDEVTYNKVFAVRMLTNRFAKEASYTVRTKNGKASVVKDPGNYPGLKLNGNKVLFNVEKVGIRFSIEKDDIDAAKAFGRPLDLEYVEDAEIETHAELNRIAYLGDMTYGSIPGILESPDITSHIGTDLSTIDDVFAEFMNAWNSIPNKYHGLKYHLVVCEEVSRKLNSIGNKFTNQTWRKIIEQEIPNLKIITEGNLNAGNELAGGGVVPAGSALFVPFSKRFVPFSFATEVKNHIDAACKDNDYDDDLRGKTKVKVGMVEPRVPECICSVRGW